MLRLLCCLWCAGVLCAGDAAEEFDALIDTALAASGQTAQPSADRASVVRRAWIDLGGRLPSVAELRAGLGQEQPAVVAALVGSPAWEHATFIWLADSLRVQSRLQDRLPGQAWIAWLRAAVAANMPWDAMVRAMLTAEGQAYAAGGGPTGFTLRDAGMPLDHAALMAQTFLGTRIGCAQCHDHPYDRWTRGEFYQFAAFSADARTQTNPGREFAGLRQRLAEAPPDLRNAARAVANLVGARVVPARKDWLEVPKDWQDAARKSGERIAAQALFPPVAPASGGDPRQRLAVWMTSPENRRFALAIGNRAWKRVFGLGLVEPVDDLRGDPAEALPPLHDRLARLVVESAFDLRRIHLVLASTRHYARGAWTGPLPAQGGVVPGRPVARLPATVWWDSLVTLASDAPDAPAPDAAGMLAETHQRLAAGGPEAVFALAERLAALRRGGPAAAKADPEAAALVQAMRPGAQRRAGRDALLRASVLPQPAPAGHPLRILGQSDRELIDNASLQPNATQALLLMNGVVDQELTVPRSRIMRELAALPDDAARIDHLWLATLGREPSPAERQRASAAFAEQPREAAADLLWALLNTAEFRMTR
jgi:hypothetical protein